MQGGEHLLGPRIVDAIPDGLGVAPEGDDAFLSLARCCDSADWESPAASASEFTLPSPHSTSLQRIISLRSLPSARSKFAAWTAFRSKAAKSNPSISDVSSLAMAAPLLYFSYC